MVKACAYLNGALLFLDMELGIGAVECYEFIFLPR